MNGDGPIPAQSVIDVYKRSVDETLIRENLRRTPEERLLQLQALQRFAEELTDAGTKLRQKPE